MKRIRFISICKSKFCAIRSSSFWGGLCLSLIKCSKTILPLCFTEKLLASVSCYFSCFLSQLDEERAEELTIRCLKGLRSLHSIFFFRKKHCFRNHTVMRFIPAITSTPSLTRSSHHALFPLCSVCVRKSENETAKSPRGEMLYLLRTTSQGHSRGQIKLLPASEGVAQNA